MWEAVLYSKNNKEYISKLITPPMGTLLPSKASLLIKWQQARTIWKFPSVWIAPRLQVSLAMYICHWLKQLKIEIYRRLKFAFNTSAHRNEFSSIPIRTQWAADTLTWLGHLHQWVPLGHVIPSHPITQWAAPTLTWLGHFHQWDPLLLLVVTKLRDDMADASKMKNTKLVKIEA